MAGFVGVGHISEHDWFSFFSLSFILFFYSFVKKPISSFECLSWGFMPNFAGLKSRTCNPICSLFKIRKYFNLNFVTVNFNQYKTMIVSINFNTTVCKFVQRAFYRCPQSRLGGNGSMLNMVVGGIRSPAIYGPKILILQDMSVDVVDFIG